MPTLQAFSVRNESPDLLELDVYDVIGESWWGDAVSAKSVRKQLKQSAAKVIKVRINSGGGDAFDGIAISNDLLNHSAKVEVDVTGIAASAASIIAMAGDTITVADNALMMIHEAWTIAMGGKTDMQSVVNELERVNQNIAATYEKASKKRGKNVSKAEFLKLMAETTWLTADEAVDLGLADSQVKPKAKIAASLWSPVMSRGQLPQSAARAILAGMKDHLEDLDPAELEKLKASAGEPEELPVASVEPPAVTHPQDATPVITSGPAPNPPPAQLELPAVQTQTPVAGGNNPSTMENESMSFLKLFALLSLPEDATEDQAIAAVKKIQTRASLGAEIETIVGASGAQAVGMVRALKEDQAKYQQLAQDVVTINVKMARKEFDSARAEGLKDRKLTPATAKYWSDRFEAEVKVQEDGSVNSDGSGIVEELKGFLAVASRVTAAPVFQPESDGSAPTAASHNGKSFEDMDPMEKHRLKRDNPELYNTLRADAVERRAI